MSMQFLRAAILVAFLLVVIWSVWSRSRDRFIRFDPFGSPSGVAEGYPVLTDAGEDGRSIVWISEGPPPDFDALLLELGTRVWMGLSNETRYGPPTDWAEFES
jgi:hypothetical protein